MWWRNRNCGKVETGYSSAVGRRSYTDVIWLLAKQKIQAKPANFDDVAVVQPHRALYRLVVDQWGLVGGPDVVTVVALVDLRGHFWLKPAFQTHCRHLRLADDGKLRRDHVLFLIGVAGEHDESGHL